MAGVKLGALPPLRHYGDVAAKFADFADLEALLPETPDYWSYATGIVEPIPMWRNGDLSCCTCTTQAQDEFVQSHRVGTPEVPPDGAVVEMYHQTGIEQGLSDLQGRYHERVLAFRKRVGLRQQDGSMEKILGYAAVNLLDLDEVRAAGYLFGGLHLCAALPRAAEFSFDYGLQHGERPRWTTAKNLPDGTPNPGSTAPGSWGGHAFYVAASVYKGFTGLTWRHRVFLSTAWVRAYGSEMYVVVTTDWTNRVAPSGFDRDGLLSLLETL